MRGKILAYDFKTGEGAVSGDDGARYHFQVAAWKDSIQPSVGQTIDFETDGNQALNIYRLSSPSPFEGDKNRIIAAILALFLGGLGIHKFYLGKNKAGIIMLLCTVVGWILFFIPPLIIWAISVAEFIIYLVTPDDQFEANYVKGDKQWF